MTTNNKHIGIWFDNFKYDYVQSFTFVNECNGFISRKPNSTEVEYVIQEILEM